MFEIRCLVGDKRLVQVLGVLDGLTLEPPVVVPVKANGTEHPISHVNGGPKEIKPTTTELLREFIQGRDTVTAKQMREHITSHGYTKNGYSFALQNLIKDKLVKRGKEYATYEVVG